MNYDYVYKARGDRVRIRVYRVKTEYEKGWDYDVFERGAGYMYSFMATAVASSFKTRRAARDHASTLFGKLTAIQPEQMTDGW